MAGARGFSVQTRDRFGAWTKRRAELAERGEAPALDKATARHRARVSTGQTDAGGRYRYAVGPSFSTKREAEDWGVERRAAILRGEPLVSSRARALTLGAYLEDVWVADVLVARGLRESTRSSYLATLKAYVIPELGAVPLRKLAARHLDRLYADLRRRELSPHTLAGVHRRLHGALEDARRRGLVAVNAAAVVGPPARPGPSSTVKVDGEAVAKVWTPEELERLLELVEATEPRLSALYGLAVRRGLRRGELAALRWDDVDLELERPELVVQAGKTKAASRTVPLSPELVDLLRRHRALQAAERLAAGARWRDAGVVFAWPDGRPLAPQWITRRLERFELAAGLPARPLHTLRHSFATELEERGVPMKTRQELLGHEDIATTLRTYTHRDAERLRRDVAAFDAGR